MKFFKHHDRMDMMYDILGWICDTMLGRSWTCGYSLFPRSTSFQALYTIIPDDSTTWPIFRYHFPNTMIIRTWCMIFLAGSVTPCWKGLQRGNIHYFQRSTSFQALYTIIPDNITTWPFFQEIFQTSWLNNHDVRYSRLDLWHHVGMVLNVWIFTIFNELLATKHCTL